MFTSKTIYDFPFVMVMPVKWIEFKTYAPIVTIEPDPAGRSLVDALINDPDFGAGHVFTASQMVKTALKQEGGPLWLALSDMMDLNPFHSLPLRVGNMLRDLDAAGRRFDIDGKSYDVKYTDHKYGNAKVYEIRPVVVRA
ncbi:hypothetical protein [Bradyrhizobium sp. URHC0002]